MKLKRNWFGLTSLCLAVGLIAVGCNDSVTQTTTPTGSSLAAKTTGDCCSDASTGGCPECAQAALASAKADDCGDCPACAGEATAKCKCEESSTVATKLTEAKPASGCCGKCAAEQAQLAGKKIEGDDDCAGCANGDSANCKCSGEGAVTEKSSATKATDAADAADAENSNPASDFARDRDVFHFLLSNKEKINRTVTETRTGVETLTESSDPVIAAKIQEHVASMYQRVENVQPIRMRDPLYREIFQHTDKIEMKLENTEEGIRVIESSEDEYVVKLIQAHAKVVSGFVDHGFEEAHKNHEPPKQ